WTPGRDLLARERIQVDAPRYMRRAVERDLRPVAKVGWIELRRAAPIQYEFDMPVRSALRNQADRLRGRMRRKRLDLDVHDRGESAQALRSDAERVDLFVQLQAHLLFGRRRPARLEVRHID